MLSFLNGLRDLTMWTALLRMGLAFVLGLCIGLERSYKNRPAGFRTHILVCLGSAVASMTGIYLYVHALLPADISRLGAAVVSGLGFIGAGTIIVLRNETVKGLTTAAGLWTTGIIGLALGAGYYEGAVIAAALVLVTETCLGKITKAVKRDPEFGVRLVYTEKTALDSAMRCCRSLRLNVIRLQVIGENNGDSAACVALLTLRPRVKADKGRLFQEVGAIAGVTDIKETEL